MIHQHTMTQLKTVQDPMKLLSPTNITATTTLSSELVTTTTPASNTGSGIGVVPSSSLNYLKIIPMVSTGSNTPTIRVTGWSKSDTGNFWIPQMLFFGTITTVTGSTANVGGGSLYAATTITKTDGDAKIYNATDNKTSAMLLVDTLGCLLVKIEFGNTTIAGTANAFIGAI